MDPGSQTRKEGPAALTTEEDYRAVEDALADAHDITEGVVWRVLDKVDEFARDKWVGPAPTLADLGALWTLVETLELRGGELIHYAEQMERALGTFNSARRDLPYREVAA